MQKDIDYKITTGSNRPIDQFGYEVTIEAKKRHTLFNKNMGHVTMRAFDVDSEGKINGTAELFSVGTDPKYQKQGVGREMVEEAVDLARSRGAKQVDLYALPDAIEFYEKLGFTRREGTNVLVKNLEELEDT